jgi:hypothetical protein
MRAVFVAPLLCAALSFGACGSVQAAEAGASGAPTASHERQPAKLAPPRGKPTAVGNARALQNGRSTLGSLNTHPATPRPPIAVARSAPVMAIGNAPAPARALPDPKTVPPARQLNAHLPIHVQAPLASTPSRHAGTAAALGGPAIYDPKKGALLGATALPHKH